MGAWDGGDQTPALEPPWHGLRAEVWANPLNDTAESGVFLHVATDQVRFYDAGRAPLPLEGIDPLVFREIMRDVDLFVGVASIGNDPNWHDRDPTNRHYAYCRDYSFGELTTRQRRAARRSQNTSRCSAFVTGRASRGVTSGWLATAGPTGSTSAEGTS